MKMVLCKLTTCLKRVIVSQLPFSIFIVLRLTNMENQYSLMGQYTSTIYGYIRDGLYEEAISILQSEQQNFPRSRAALSLLGYCYYRVNDFGSAVQAYDQLLTICPDVEEYKLYYAQSLYKAGMFSDATKAAVRVESEQYRQRRIMLQAIIKYNQDDFVSSRSLLDQCQQDDTDVLKNNAAIAYKQGKFELARNQYNEAINLLGYQADLSYNIALCYYREVR